MKKATSLCLSILCLFFLTGCFGSETLDTSSGEAYTKSLLAVYEALPESDKMLFLDNFIIAVNGEVVGVSALDRGEGPLVRALKFYNMGYATSDNFKNLHGKTSADIIAEGQAILRVDITRRLNDAIARLPAQEKDVAEAKAIEEGKEHVIVDLTSPAQALESTNPREKGLFGKLALPIVIKNNSAFTFHGFEDGEMEVFDKNGKNINTIPFKLSEFVGDDKTEPFYYGRDGVAPGKELKGTIVVFIRSAMLPYPASQVYYARFLPGKGLEMQLRGSTRYLQPYEAEVKDLEEIKAEIQTINAELAKLP